MMAKRKSAVRAADSTPHSDTQARTALVCFVAIEMVALPSLLWWGRGGWFTFDDWDLLSQRTGGSPHDLMLPHGDHWSTLPILVYRLLWWVFGIRSYVPYQFTVVLLHLTAVALLRVVMRRAGCAPWTATLFAGVFVFFGVAADTILVAFFMTFVGSLVFGLAHLLLADHGGRVDRRDALGLLAGLAGMLFSGVAVTMVGVVGLSTLVRRGWRVALLHTAPLGALYLVWLLVIGRDGERLPLTRPTRSEIARFVAVGVQATFGGLGQVPGVGVALAAILVVGSVLGVTGAGGALRDRFAEPLALLAGAAIFLVITGYGRAGKLLFNGGGGPENARASRYVYLVAAMALPALAVAADSIIRRWRLLTPLVVLAVLLGLPGNLRKLSDFHQGAAARDAARTYILAAPRLPPAASLPRSIQPDAFHAPGLTLGWLIDGVRSDRVPPPEPMSAKDRTTEILRLALRPTTAGRTGSCAAIRGPTQLVLRRGEAVSVARGTVEVVYVPVSAARSRPVHFGRSLTGTLMLVAETGPLRLVLTSSPSNNRLCTTSRRA
jgi:hypothetical protein